MSYIALARKWRPRTFSQLVGQEHINKALIKSLNQQRLHHAYLFTGTRGVGKTSVARLLAKALNCEQGISAEPCLQCDACLAIEQGCFVDLIEIDGASRTRVEDTRDILDNVPYAPTNGRFKIYLIDEVHMLSQHSFNALLKTLEEPPSHVKFLLATTDPQKLPITVLSRCLQFNLKHLLPDIICSQLQTILEDEKLTYEKQALDLIARAAHGSMRDALSLLDQAIAGCDDTLSTQNIKNILGYTQQDYALQLLQALIDRSPQKLITISRQIATEGGYFHYTLEEMLSYLHQITISQHLTDNHPLICPTPEIQALSALISPEDVQLFYQIGLKGAEELHLAPTIGIGFEMTLLRMHTFQPVRLETQPALVSPSAEGENKIQVAVNPPLHSEPSPILTISEPVVTLPDSENASWADILKKITLTGLAANAAANAELVSKSGSEIRLRVEKGHLSVFTPMVISRIELELTKYYKEKIKLALSSDQPTQSSPAQQKIVSQTKQHQEAVASLEADPFFQQLHNEFSAELVKNSISFLKDDL